MKNIATINGICNHYGSAVSPPVISVIQNNVPNFVMINGVPIMTTEDKVDTPSHIYDYDSEGNPLYHSHSNQIIDNLYQSFVTVEGNIIVVENDKNNTNDTRIESAGQSIVRVE